jgi:hypothetical protein
MHNAFFIGVCSHSNRCERKRRVMFDEYSFNGNTNTHKVSLTFKSGFMQDAATKVITWQLPSAMMKC